MKTRFIDIEDGHTIATIPEDLKLPLKTVMRVNFLTPTGEAYEKDYRLYRLEDGTVTLIQRLQRGGIVWEAERLIWLRDLGDDEIGKSKDYNEYPWEEFENEAGDDIDNLIDLTYDMETEADDQMGEDFSIQISENIDLKDRSGEGSGGSPGLRDYDCP